MFEERDSIRRNSIALGLVALITSLLLASTYHGTKDAIDQAIRDAEKKALLEIIPLSQHNNDLLVDTLPIPEQFWPRLGLQEARNLYIARDENQQPIAVIFPCIASGGYSGDIELLVGIRMDGSIAGVRATNHNETPGLGDKVEIKKSDWILGFNGKSLTNPQPSGWAVAKDDGKFDQFTGATITPRAVVKQVYAALQYFVEDRERIIKASSTGMEPQS